MTSGAKDALKLSGKALKEGQATDPLDKGGDADPRHHGGKPGA
jgi:hypothetical protein